MSARIVTRPLAESEAFAALFDLPTVLAARAIVEPNTGCILWIGGTNRGHGRVRVAVDTPDGLVVAWWYTHVLAWTCVHGPLPPGAVLDHRCRVRACMNLAHLEPVTSRENTLRGVGPSAANARRDRCGRCGGPFDHERVGSRRERSCTACRRARKAAARQRARADARP